MIHRSAEDDDHHVSAAMLLVYSADHVACSEVITAAHDAMRTGGRIPIDVGANLRKLSLAADPT